MVRYYFSADYLSAVDLLISDELFGILIYSTDSYMDFLNYFYFYLLRCYPLRLARINLDLVALVREKSPKHGGSKIKWKKEKILE